MFDLTCSQFGRTKKRIMCFSIIKLLYKFLRNYLLNINIGGSSVFTLNLVVKHEP